MKYRAFLSYSHADDAFAARFHKDLERWRADRGLVGRTTERGPVPRSLQPIFRDRDDFAVGRTLGEATVEALEASDFLILLCSPAAAKSVYVNEEVRAFKALGGAGRIIPVIIDGEPGDPARNCFPEALIRKVGPDGELTDEVEEPLAADARDHGDGPRRALAKVIAGLLGVPFDEIVRRAEQAQRRRNRLYSGVAAAMAVLATAAGAFGWLAETRRVAAERNYRAAVSAADSLLGEVGEELIRTQGVGLATTKRLLSRAEAIYDELIVSLPGAVEVKAGKIAALSVFSRAYAAKGDAAAADEALAEAERLTRAMAADLPGDADDAPPVAMLQVERARLVSGAGDYDKAFELYEAALATFRGESFRAIMDDEQARYVASAAIQFGALHAIYGDPAKGEAALDEALALAVEWRPGAQADGQPGASSESAPEWLGLESAALFTSAQIAARRDDFETARAKTLQSIEVAEALAAFLPDSAQVRTQIATALQTAAALAERLGLDAAAAEEAARADRILADIAAVDRDNRDAQIRNALRDAERAVERIGAGQGAEAAPELAAALARLEAEWRAAPDREFVAATARQAFGIGTDALNGAGYHDEALAAARFLIALEERADDDGAAERRLFAHRRAMAAEQGREDYAAALAHAEAALEIERRLAAADPSRRQLLAEAVWSTGELLWRLSRREEAEARYREVVDLYDALAVERPDDAGVGGALSWTCINLGELKALNGDPAGARPVFARCLENAERMIALFPDSRSTQLDLAWATARVALQERDAARWREVGRILAAADAAEPLGDLEDELLTVARIASVSP